MQVLFSRDRTTRVSHCDSITIILVGDSSISPLNRTFHGVTSGAIKSYRRRRNHRDVASIKISDKATLSLRRWNFDFKQLRESSKVRDK